MNHLQRMLAISLLFIGGMTGANAHAMLDHTEPAVGSTVKTPPVEVKLWFTEALEPAFSTVQVFDQQGQRVDQQDAQPQPSKAKVFRVALKPLSPGIYKVVWRVVSIDSHVTKGDFTFQVAP